MKFNGWYAALGGLALAALWNSQRSGEMTEKRDRVYRECLSGRIPVEKMREIARAFEKVRCYPQAHMIRTRIALKELSPELQTQRRELFAKGMASKNGPGVLRLAHAFEEQGATSSAAALRRHARALERAAVAEPQPVVTPEPATPEPVTPEPDEAGTQEVGIPTVGILNGKAPHVAVS